MTVGLLRNLKYPHPGQSYRYIYMYIFLLACWCLVNSEQNKCEDTSLMCEYEQVTSIPRSVPQNVEVLKISNSNIAVIPSNALKHLPPLKRFTIENSNIGEIESCAFFNLSEVKLYIKGSSVQTVKPYAFSFLSKVDMTFESSNFKTLSPHSFANIKQVSYLDFVKVNISDFGMQTFHNVSDVKTLQIRNSQFRNLHTKTGSSVLKQAVFFNNIIENGCNSSQYMQISYNNIVTCNCCGNTASSYLPPDNEVKCPSGQEFPSSSSAMYQTAMLSSADSAVIESTTTTPVLLSGTKVHSETDFRTTAGNDMTTVTMVTNSSGQPPVNKETTMTTSSAISKVKIKDSVATFTEVTKATNKVTSENVIKSSESTMDKSSTSLFGRINTQFTNAVLDIKNDSVTSNYNPDEGASIPVMNTTAARRVTVSVSITDTNSGTTKQRYTTTTESAIDSDEVTDHTNRIRPTKVESTPQRRKAILVPCVNQPKKAKTATVTSGQFSVRKFQFEVLIAVILIGLVSTV